jgi:hypothetical protein
MSLLGLLLAMSILHTKRQIRINIPMSPDKPLLDSCNFPGACKQNTTISPIAVAQTEQPKLIQVGSKHPIKRVDEQITTANMVLSSMMTDDTFTHSNKDFNITTRGNIQVILSGYTTNKAYAIHNH